MSKLSVADRTFLEAVFGMSGGSVLDFTNTAFAQFFDDLDVDIYEETYAEYGVSKAKRLRTFWKLGSGSQVSTGLGALADYISARKLTGGCEDVTDEQVAKVRDIAQDLADYPVALAAGVPVAISTGASVSKNLISIEIHDEIYRHIQPYLASGDHFHAVEESYKVVREKLRELTGSERSTDIFNENAQNKKHFAALFGKATPTNGAEADFFRGIGYLHLGVQFLRNEKAHTLATFVEPNLAIHYISLASLAYDLITRHVSDEVAKEVEDLVVAKRRSYRTAGAFYSDFARGKWLAGLHLPVSMSSVSVRRLLKEKWVIEADLTRSWDDSNLLFMRLELVVDEISENDIDHLLSLPTKDSYDNNQEAGMWSFLEFVQERYPDRVSSRAESRIAEFASR